MHNVIYNFNTKFSKPLTNDPKSPLESVVTDKTCFWISFDVVEGDMIPDGLAPSSHMLLKLSGPSSWSKGTLFSAKAACFLVPNWTSDSFVNLCVSLSPATYLK